MYCPQCRTANPDTAQVCSSCGTVLAPVTTVRIQQAPTSGLAITSLVLAILGFITCFVTTLPALICGLIALVRIHRSRGQLRGTGLAIAGIVVPAVCVLFLLPVQMAILMPALFKARGLAQRTACGTNLKGLGVAMMIYQNDYRDALPTPETWCDLLVEHADVSPKAFQCPGGLPAMCHYAMNANLRTAGADPPADMVLLFESTLGWNGVGGPQDLTTDYHQQQGCNVLFSDGHVEFVPAQRIGQLKWTAKEP